METMRETGTVLPFSTGGAGVSPGQVAAVCRAVAAIASTDKSRPALQGVIVEPGDNGIVLTATDSYRLLTVAVETGHGATVPAFDPFLLSARELANAAKNVKKNVAACAIEYAAGESSARFTVGGDVFAVPVIDGSVTQWRRLIPTDPVWPATGETFSMNASLLAGLLDSFSMILSAGSGNRDNRVSFSQVSPTKVTMLTAVTDGVVATGLVMPLR
jgi:hypothetical protein